MSLNCKPGDLAVIVLPKVSDYNLGRLVTILGPSCVGLPYWDVRVEGSPARVKHIGGQSSMSMRSNIEDHRLRPIRPQSDDATDETLLWKDVPSKEGQPA